MKYKENFNNIENTNRFQYYFVTLDQVPIFEEISYLYYIVSLRRPKNLFGKCKNQRKRYAFKMRQFVPVFHGPMNTDKWFNGHRRSRYPNAKTAHAHFFMYTLYTRTRETSIIRTRKVKVFLFCLIEF